MAVVWIWDFRVLDPVSMVDGSGMASFDAIKLDLAPQRLRVRTRVK